MNRIITRQKIIHHMCVVALQEEMQGPPLTLGDYISIISDGPNKEERQILWDKMSKIYDRCIEPYMEIKKQDKSND